MPPSSSVPLRNVALVAHVDHGKTTLVDALLRATGTFSDHAAVVDRIMDSNDQERERGITILAKAASVTWNDVQINLVDTPGHSDFGGEVERALSMVDGVILLVDAAEGPLPQTRYVLSKALALGLPTVVVVNKVDRQDARPEEVLDEIYQLFMDLDADENSIEFPVISAIARDGKAVSGIGMPGEDDDLTPLFQAIVDTIPAPPGDPDAPLQAIVTNLDASEYLGRLAIGRVMQGTLRRGEQVALCEEDEGQNPLRRKLTQLMSFSGIGRLEVDAIRAGDLFIVAGFPEVEIGGQFLTSRHLRDRLNKEILGNVSIKVEPTESPDIIEVSGRGELQLAVLIETMRREGYELQVSRPEVIVKDIDGSRHEPLERAVIDVPDEHVGTVTQALAPRKGRVTDLRPGDTGRTIVTVEAPARGLIGFRSQLLTATRGTALMHQHNAGWVAWVGDLPTRKGGAMISDRQGTSTGYAIGNLQERGEMFIGSSVAVYEGMIVGENSRSDDMMINIVREKQKTNIRTHSADEAIKLVPPREVTLENAIEFIGDDELVEVTPQSLRLRKRILKESDRRRTNKK